MVDNIVVSGKNVRQSKAGEFYSNLFGNRVNVNTVWEIKIDEFSLKPAYQKSKLPISTTILYMYKFLKLLNYLYALQIWIFSSKSIIVTVHL